MSKDCFTCTHIKVCDVFRGIRLIESEYHFALFSQLFTSIGDLCVYYDELPPIIQKGEEIVPNQVRLSKHTAQAEDIVPEVMSDGESSA